MRGVEKFSIVVLVVFLSTWVARSSALLNQKLSNSLLKKGVPFSYCVSLREAETISVQCSWVKNALREYCPLWSNSFTLSIMITLHVRLEKARQSSFCKQGPMRMGIT